MDFRQLGRTGLRVSGFGMGCGNFGGMGSAPEARVEEAIGLAFPPTQWHEIGDLFGTRRD